MDILNFLETMNENKTFHLLITFIVLDVIFGVLRSLKQKKLNSCVGIDGLIRKAGMLISEVFFFYIDKTISLNLIGFIPEELKNFFNLEEIGIGILFGSLFIIFEFMSSLKNMALCDLPIPKLFKKLLNKILTEFTEEMKLTEEEKMKNKIAEKEEKIQAISKNIEKDYERFKDLYTED